jgi:hypothetical protein
LFLMLFDYHGKQNSRDLQLLPCGAHITGVQGGSVSTLPVCTLTKWTNGDFMSGFWGHLFHDRCIQCWWMARTSVFS